MAALAAVKLNPWADRQRAGPQQMKIKEEDQTTKETEQ
jgi:hypothetical protein